MCMCNLGYTYSMNNIFSLIRAIDFLNGCSSPFPLLSIVANQHPLRHSSLKYLSLERMKFLETVVFYKTKEESNLQSGPII